MKKFFQKDDAIPLLILVTFITIIILWSSAAVLGKYQLCRYYYSEMNTISCMATTLPSVVRR